MAAYDFCMWPIGDVDGHDRVERRLIAMQERNAPTEEMRNYMISEGFMKGKLTLSRLCEVTSSGQAERFGLAHRKGHIAVGRDASKSHSGRS